MTLPVDMTLALDPGLYIPGHKPIVPVEIIDTHWLVSKPPIQSSSIVGSDPKLASVLLYAPGFRELVPGGIASGGYTLVSDSGGSDAFIDTGAGGRYLDCSNSGACVNLNTDYNAGTVAATVSVLVEFPLDQSLSGFVGDGVLRFNGTSLDFHGASITFDPATLSAGPHRITVCAWKNTSVEGVRFFIDGVLVGSTTSNTFPGKMTIKGFGNVNISLNKDRGAAIYDSFVWRDMALSDEAIVEHARDPYQFLRVLG